jgi:hypothetical protein
MAKPGEEERRLKDRPKVADRRQEKPGPTKVPRQEK